ncbi:hypothetical protein EG329_005244 [Mollisiaceae sp. DMI_Dod_QoI]|nr:hypothetical protein EG329_005244 [Helotiales sp. DMI_Dod_QoI]
MSKRRSDTSPSEPSAQPTKKAKISSGSDAAVTKLLSLTPSHLQDMPHETLIGHMSELQAAYRKLQSSSALALSTSSANVVKAPAEADDPIKVKEMTRKLSNMMSSGITKQMKWQPSCKTSGKRWTYSSMVPSEAIFYKLFRLKEEKKAFKQKKILLNDFENITGELSASIRYGYLRVVSKDITLKWDKDALSFSVSGLYGL